MEEDTIIVEQFSKKRYEAYKKKNIQFRVVSGKGRLCEVKAFDCGENKDQVFVESTYKHLGHDYTSGYYASQKNGCTQYKEQDGKLFIYRGPWFSHNDLVVRTKDGTMGRTIFFWYGIRPKEKMYLENWGAYSPYEDMHDSQFSQCTLGCNLTDKDYKGEKKLNHFRLATDKDVEDYRNALRSHRITWEDDGRFYHYPHVGDRYFEIFFNHGMADFRERVMESEDTRPEISRLIMECNTTYGRELREKRVRERVANINKALGLE